MYNLHLNNAATFTVARSLLSPPPCQKLKTLWRSFYVSALLSPEACVQMNLKEKNHFTLKINTMISTEHVCSYRFGNSMYSDNRFLFKFLTHFYCTTAGYVRLSKKAYGVLTRRVCVCVCPQCFFRV